MPSRPISGNPRATSSILKSKILFIATTLSLTALIVSTLIYIFHNLWSSFFHRSRTRPFEEIAPLNLQKFTYKELKSATNDFNQENAIGKGGSGSVFRGILKDGKSVAVKSIDSSSLQADKEFRNELTILGSIKSPHIVSLLGYCVYKNKRILVYEYMPNRSLQEFLFCDGNSGLTVVGWDRRFEIIQDVAKALEFLHNECDPPVIHGDIKPSNVLLDWGFKAKVCDFGLSRLKVEEGGGDEMFSQELDRSQEIIVNASSSNNCLVNQDPQSTNLSIPSQKGKEVLRIGVLNDELCGKIEHCTNELDLSPLRHLGAVSKDWWWKQDGNSGELCSKDYVKEWIGSQICARTNPDVNLDLGEASQADVSQSHSINEPKKMQDWWKEENLEEMSSKKSKKMKHKPAHFGLGQCFHLVKGGRRCKEMKGEQGVDLFSRELSSNTSMRGTLCYAAPEFGACGLTFLMEKTDIYSLGVLVLVIVSGKRPLNLLNSPVNLEKANLVSWCRQLAQSGNVLELVDERLKEVYNKEQATLCINLALACLQRMPELRPDIGDIVRILEGEMDLPQVPFEFSPSPPCKLSSESRRKHRKTDAGFCIDLFSV